MSPTFNSSRSTAGHFVSVYEFGVGMGVLCRGQGDAIGLFGPGWQTPPDLARRSVRGNAPEWGTCPPDLMWSALCALP